MDKLQAGFVGGWIDPEESCDIPFFSPPAKSAGGNVTVVVKEESKTVPSWTTNLTIPKLSQSILPLLPKDLVKPAKVTEQSPNGQVNPNGWTSGIPDKMLIKKSDGLITYSPFKR